MLYARTLFSTIYVLWIQIAFVELLYEDDPCLLKDGVYGQCTRVSLCPSALKNLKSRIKPQHCGFVGIEPIVCCRFPPGTKTKYFCKSYYYRTTPKYIIIGTPAKPKEYLHMAALGFGDPNDIKWRCGGSLISPKFILTAAHCLQSSELGPVRYVRLGHINLTSPDANSQDFTITKAHRHPLYKASSNYYDIALLQLNVTIEIDEVRKPACLQAEFQIPEDKQLTATGWGLTEFAGEPSDHLLKVNLTIYNNTFCRSTYASQPRRKLSNGIVEDTQLCAGGRNGGGEDTCQGDSGGPLQYKLTEEDLKGMFTVVGITSFGRACGILNSPGVYTRVSFYIPWIENIIWANDTMDLKRP